jgi:hypothetical protein
MEAVSTSETLVNLYKTTQCYIREDSHLHTHCHENLKSGDFNVHHATVYFVSGNCMFHKC